MKPKPMPPAVFALDKSGVVAQKPRTFATGRDLDQTAEIRFFHFPFGINRAR